VNVRKTVSLYSFLHAGYPLAVSCLCPAVASLIWCWAC
jgi:hypothetical protein